MKYIMKLSNQYEVEAKDEEEAYVQLGEHLDRINSTAETEFWDSIDVEATELNLEDVADLDVDEDEIDITDNEMICHQCGFISCQCPDKDDIV